MQLLLTLDERKVVTRALEKCLAQAQGDEFVRRRAAAGELLNHLIDNDMRFSTDELDDLSDILRACRREMESRIAAETDPHAKAALCEQQNILEHAADKVTEACAMS
jgi:hypothetical protein